MSKRQRAKANEHEQANRIFRVIALQPIALDLECPKIFALKVAGLECVYSISKVHQRLGKQYAEGGLRVGVTFSMKSDGDLVQAAAHGLDLVDDLFSAISVATGSHCEASEVLEAVDTTVPSKPRFMRVLTPTLRHSQIALTVEDLKQVQLLVAHWDGLSRGDRLRRASRSYMRALGASDTVEAFQNAYMGLESLEPVLAELLNVEAGAETIKGKCTNCQFEYERKRTVLNGVRSYICGPRHGVKASPEQKGDWKRINDLRQKLFHSLVDRKAILKDVHAALPAAMHNLHDAISCASHAHSLESDCFKFRLGLNKAILLGDGEAKSDKPLVGATPLIESRTVKWVKSSSHGLVPEFEIRTKGLRVVRGRSLWFSGPWQLGSEKELLPARFEMGSRQGSEP